MKFDPKDVDGITIAQVWANFAGEVLPADASAVQRDEMRKAFFAGFNECMALIRDVIPRLSDAHGIRTLERFNNELHEYAEALARKT